jgi:hypothetical protein
MNAADSQSSIAERYVHVAGDGSVHAEGFSVAG